MEDQRAKPIQETPKDAASAAPRPEHTGTPRPILLLGMHRSGTSAIARVLEMLGAYPGEADELLPPHAQDNPTGYWERADIVLEHHRFLEAAGYGWDRVAWFDVQRVDEAAKAELAAKLRPIFDKLQARGTSWLIKDPRLSLLLPLWMEWIEGAVFVVAVRDPREIAASMQDGPRGVYTSHFLLALWEKYLRSALAALMGKEVLFVSYARLLEEPSAQATRLCLALRALGATDLRPADDAQMRTFLDPQLRRSTSRPHVQLSPQQSALHEWLEEQCRAPAVVRVEQFPDGSPPDLTLAEFQHAMDEATHGRNRALGESSQWRLQVDTAVAVSKAPLHLELQQALSDSGELMHKLSERELLLNSLALEHAHLERSATQRQQECEQLHERITTLILAHKEHDRILTTLASELDQQRLQSEALRTQNEIAQRRINALSSELAQQRLDAERLSADRDEFAKAKNELEQEKDQWHAERERLERSLDAARRRNEQLEAGHGDLARSVDQARDQAAASARHAAALEAGMDAMRRSWSWRLSAPLRVFGKLRLPRLSWNFEQALYRFYYALPGPSVARKRAFVLWLHEHARWLTQRTFSYRLNEQAKALERQRITNQEQRDRLQRMDAERAQVLIAAMTHRPLISIVLPVYNVDGRWLAAAVESVRRQFYPYWELCIADDASTREETREALKTIAQLGDKRIKIRKLAKNAGIANASNAALELATGEFVGLLDHDDELTRDALLEVARTIEADDPDFVYS
ncbi:MAG TPA: glycosyltransferase, partial [Rudaea sp.]